MSADPSSPPDKPASLRVPAVPDEYVKKPVSWLPVLSYPLVLLLLISSLLWGVGVAWKALLPISTPVRSSSVAHRTATPRPVPTPTATYQGVSSVPSISCPNPPVAQTNGPALSFCAPTYKGNVAGPFGVRIVLIGENFPALPTQWFIPKHAALSDKDTLHQCSPDNKQGCQALSPPEEHKDLGHGTFLFSWTWTKHNSFPNEQGNYIITAQVGQQLVTTPIAADFTLLSAQAPCISITNGQGSADCVIHRLSFHQGDKLTIRGKNWLLGWNPKGTAPLDIQIEIVATCTHVGTCDAPKLFDILVASQDIARDGSFLVTPSYLVTAKGLYTVSAWNITKDAGAPGGLQNTTANEALLFGKGVGDLLLQVQ
jgi:hypothetical protein